MLARCSEVACLSPASTAVADQSDGVSEGHDSSLGLDSLRMTRLIAPAIFLMVSLCANRPSSAQQAPTEKPRYPWAEKMFSELEHDFGVVARGSDAKYRITINNLYQEDVHIQQITTTCGCTAVRPSKETLASREKAEIEITMDTRKFTNLKTSSVVVVFDKPLFGEVRIPIQAYIRTDVVLTPGGVDFQGVTQGSAVTRKLNIAYAGRDDWKIHEVINKSPHLETSLKETGRANNRVNYELEVSLKPDAPVGALREQLTLITDDAANPRIPVLVDARVEGEYTINPEIIDFGTVKPGTAVSKNIVVRGKKPFRVAGVTSADLGDRLVARLPQESKPIQIVPLTLTAPDTPGVIDQVVQLQIDGVAQPVPCRVFAKVASPDASQP